MSKGSGLESYLKSSIEQYPDIKSITLRSSEGTELCSVNRQFYEGSSTYHLVPSFTVSADQSSRLGVGPVQYTIVWCDGCIVLQFKVELVVIAVLLEENANVGIMNEFITHVSEKLRPFCTSL